MASPQSSSRSRASSQAATPRRPKLTRSSATAPSLAMSNASRKDLACLHSSSRATAILTRMALYSRSPDDSPEDRRASSASLCSLGEADQHRKGTAAEQIFHAQYFSFPSFEDFLEEEERAERLEQK